MSMPLEMTPYTNGPPREKPPCMLPGTKCKRVLLVDDEQSIIASLRRLLHREPYDLVTANCAEEALGVMEQQQAQLVVTDHRMPGMNGIELLGHIRQRWPDTLRIVLSGYSEIRTLITAVNEGEIYKFVSKPWNDEELRLHIRRALEQYDLVAENRRLTVEVVQQNQKLSALNELLDQRASDASIGLACVQKLFEVMDVGVLTVDETGLIVAANRRARQVLCPQQSPCIGLPASVALRDGPDEQLLKVVTTATDPATGRFAWKEQSFEWRTQPLVEHNTWLGNVVTLWKVVPYRTRPTPD